LTARAKPVRPHIARSRVAIILLGLVAYASLVNATHHHGWTGAPTAGSRIRSSEDSNSNGAPASDHKSHCATCRLQRSFDSGLRSPSISLELIRQAVTYQTCSHKPNLLGACVVFSGRAPPSSAS
jgi:hypothetical protein